MNRLKGQAIAGPEWAAVLSITVIAAVLRIAGFGRLGLDHFDEGIYASVGLWSLSPEGLRGIDPGLIPYSPPAYPFAVGIAYLVAGPSDLAAIAVSILAGIATIPIVAFLGRRAFGTGFGVATAGFAAASLPHITFSRMALTDSLFLFTWLVGIALGAVFLEKPGPIRAMLLGVAVGAAQLVKYNGWLVGAIVTLTAMLAPLTSTRDRDWRRLLRVFGWGSLAAATAAMVYWPWFQFVEAHEGYRSLLRHQRGYLAGSPAWPLHWLTQVRQTVALSFPKLEGSPGVLLACLGMILLSILARARIQRPIWTVLLVGGLGVLLSRATLGWWLGLGFIYYGLRSDSTCVRLLAVWWVVLTILTPFYHPYARLWLPVEAAGWITSGLVVGVILLRESRPSWECLRVNRLSLALVGLAVALSWSIPTLIPPPAKQLPGGLGVHRDALRHAASRLAAKVGRDVRTIAILGRPVLPFYVSGTLARRGINVYRLGSSAELSMASEAWAIVDAVQLRQEDGTGLTLSRLLDQWEVVAEDSATLSNATLLDVDPGAAMGELSARTASLFLLRPKSPNRTRLAPWSRPDS